MSRRGQSAALRRRPGPSGHGLCAPQSRCAHRYEARLWLVACRASLTISSSIASPASTSSSSVMRGKPLRRDGAVARERRDVDEGGEARAVVAVRRPRSRASSDSCRDSFRHRARRGRRFRCRPPRAAIWRYAGRTSCASAPSAIEPLRDAGLRGIRPQHGDGVAGAGLDPDDRAVRAGEAEHQQRVRLVLSASASGNSRSTALVGHGKDVAGQFDIGEGRAAQPRQPRHQRLRRIIGRAGKRAEAGDENAKLFAHRSTPRSVRRRPPA